MAKPLEPEIINPGGSDVDRRAFDANRRALLVERLSRKLYRTLMALLKRALQ